MISSCHQSYNSLKLIIIEKAAKAIAKLESHNMDEFAVFEVGLFARASPVPRHIS